MQKIRINKLTASDHVKRALKRREKNKAGGLLSIQIEAKTDKPTNWKALWISFGDGAFSKKNNSCGSDLSFNRSSRSGECGLSNHGTCLLFPIFHIEKKHQLKNETEVVMYRPLYMIVEN